ncbi:MAG: ABC transporter ATP-binding protein [Bacteroidales bacterium]
MAISIQNISKSFDHKTVLKDITLNLPNGNLMCLLGPSGSGKTTLIRLILGEIAPDHGTITINETLIPNLAIMKNIGFMPQSDALYEDLSAIDNLFFFGRLYRMKRSKMQQRAMEVLEMVALSDDKKKRVSKFSGGMKKRLSLAIALLNKPEILLLDEPTVGIDPLLRRTIWEQFKQFRNQGCTIIVTTHIMDEVTECDYASLSLEGKLLAFDKLPHLLNATPNQRIEELFLMSK